MKTDTLLKRTTNALLDLVAELSPKIPLPSESELSRTLEVSRTTVRGALRHLEKCGIVVRDGAQLTLVRKPTEHDHFADAQTLGPQERIEHMLMERMLRGGWAPGHEFSESDLARACGVSAATVREFLIGFSRYQLIEKRSRGGWRLLGLDAGFANEVADMRYLIEMAAIHEFLSRHDPHRQHQIDTFLDRHHELAGDLDARYLDFPTLDTDFHTYFISHLKNRFARSFIDIVAFTYHYHYRWTTAEQKGRVAASLKDHIGILEALRQEQPFLAKERLSAHLAAARSSLIAALSGAG
jgi:DNA-binding GntR family transcriptional regulator